MGIFDFLNPSALAAGSQALVPNPAANFAAPASSPPSSPSNDFQGPGLFQRLFPKRDPNTGEQGGILANPLFRLGLNLLARSGPQAHPHSLGQDIAGSVNDYSTQRDQELAAKDQALTGYAKQHAWNTQQGKDAWAKDLPDIQGFLSLANASGNPDAVKAQAPDATIGANPPVGKIPQTFAPLFDAAQKAHPELPPGILPAMGFAESSFNPNAVGPEVKDKTGSWNARGIGQFSPATAKGLGIDPMNPEQAIPAMGDYLAQNLKMFGGNLDKAIAAYGGGLVNGQITPNGQAYVDKIKKLAAAYAGGEAIAAPTSIIPPGLPQQPPAPVQLPASPQMVPPPPPKGFGNPTIDNFTPGLPLSGNQTMDNFAPPVRPGPGTNIIAPPPPPLSAPPPVPQGPPAGVAPSAAPPVAPVVAPPTPAQTAQPAPAGDQPTIPPDIIKFNDKGFPTKASMVAALQALPPQVRNAVILGAWMKAQGDKGEFAENLGTALLSMGEKAYPKAGAKAFTNVQTVWEKDSNGQNVPVNIGMTPEGTYERIPGVSGVKVSGSQLPPLDMSDPATKAGVQAMADRARLTGIIPRSLGPEMARAVVLQIGQDQQKDKASTAQDILRQMNLKADQSARTPIIKQAAVTNAFIATMEANMKIVEDKMPLGGTDVMPILAQYLQWGKDKVLADPNVPQYATALITVMDEYAKILSGATGGAQSTDAMRNQVFSMLDRASTNEQVKAVFDGVIRPDAQNRRDGYQITLDALSGDMSHQADLHNKGVSQPQQTPLAKAPTTITTPVVPGKPRTITVNGKPVTVTEHQ